MRILFLSLLCVAASGCATMTDDTPRVARQECKAVAVYSGPEAIRSQVHGNGPTDPLARAEGAMDIHRVKGDPPRTLRSPPGTGLLNDAARDC